MINTKRFGFSLGIGMILMAAPLATHHGTSVSYHISHPVTMKGMVTEFHYANPHPQLYFDVQTRREM